MGSDPPSDDDGPENKEVAHRSQAAKVSDAALWERRDETSHPAPIGYMLEYQFEMITPMDQLLERETVLQDREKRLYEGGVVCELKWKDDMSCSACPVHEVGQDTDLSLLCRLGREQERIRSLIVTKENL